LYKNKRILAIIPARIESKRLFQKNLRELKGRPLFCWSILSALNSSYLDEVVVSSDSDEIVKISKEYGASAPFLRPKKLATDDIRGYYALEHAVEFYRSDLNKTFDYIMCLQPSSPLRTSEDIDCAIEYLINKKADSVVSVCESTHPTDWINTLPKDFSMINFLTDSVKLKRSQELNKEYRLNGAIYMAKTNLLLEEETFFLKSNVFAYEMPATRSVDIDNIVDFKLAEVLMAVRCDNDPEHIS